MKFVTLKHSGINLSQIIFGAWQAGKQYWTSINDKESVAAFRAAYEHGVTTFDTAEAYGDGHSERILAEALWRERDRIVIATKVSWDHLEYNQLVAACERSLKNLRTDYIDLYQIHWPTGSFGSKQVSIAESMKALTSLKESGKIRAIGVSNFNRQQLEEAMQYGPIDSNQVPYSLLWRYYENNLFNFCRKHKIAVLAYSPLAQGLLTGKIKKPLTLESGDHRVANRLFHGELLDQSLAVVEKLKPIAASYGISLAQLALAWAAAEPFVCPIAGARNSQQAIDNAKAGAVTLSPEDVAAMNNLSQKVVAQVGDEDLLWEWETGIGDNG